MKSFDNIGAVRAHLRAVLPSEVLKKYDENGHFEFACEYFMDAQGDDRAIEDIKRGYCEAYSDSEIDIPGAIQINAIMSLGVFSDDYEAVYQAVRDGVKFIEDMSELEIGRYVDTLENRAICSEALIKYPALRISNLCKDVVFQRAYSEHLDAYARAKRFSQGAVVG